MYGIMYSAVFANHHVIKLYDSRTRADASGPTPGHGISLARIRRYRRRSPTRLIRRSLPAAFERSLAPTQRPNLPPTGRVFRERSARSRTQSTTEDEPYPRRDSQHDQGFYCEGSLTILRCHVPSLRSP
jgi:hypothetical protein